MKFITITLAALASLTIAAPTKEEEYTQPGGDHSYHDILSRRVVAPAVIAFWKVFGVALASNFAGKTIGERVLNDQFGKQTKRDNEAEQTFDEARETFINRYTRALLKEDPHNGTADAAVCAGVGYYVSAPNATIWVANFEFQWLGREHEYDCAILAGPVTVNVGNATAADFAYAAPANSTYKNGILTIA